MYRIHQRVGVMLMFLAMWKAGFKFASVGAFGIMMFSVLPSFLIWNIQKLIIGRSSLGYIDFEDNEFLSSGFWSICILYYGMLLIGMIGGLILYINDDRN